MIQSNIFFFLTSVAVPSTIPRFNQWLRTRVTGSTWFARAIALLESVWPTWGRTGSPVAPRVVIGWFCERNHDLFEHISRWLVLQNESEIYKTSLLVTRCITFKVCGITPPPPIQLYTVAKACLQLLLRLLINAYKVAYTCLYGCLLLLIWLLITVYKVA